MVIQCKGCSKRFRLDDTLLKTGGSRVRCSKCKEVFKVYPPETNTPPEVATESSDQSASALPAERRKSPRIQVSIPALCNSTGSDGQPLDLHIGVIKEVSQEGVAIELFLSSISEVVSLSFIGLDNKDVQINGKVRHSSSTRSGKMRFGLSLLGSPVDINEFVTQAVRSYHHSPAPGRQAATNRQATPN